MVPKAVTREAALEEIRAILKGGRVTMKTVVSLRGLHAWMANAFEAWRPCLPALFVLGAADPARASRLAWKTCPSQVATDLEIWQRLLERERSDKFLADPVLDLDAVVMVDA